MGWTYFENLGGFPLADTIWRRGVWTAEPDTFDHAYGLPQVMTAGLSTIGANPFQPGGPRRISTTSPDDMSWIRGKHSMKFGYDGRYYRPAALVQQTPNSILTFENRFTNQPNVAGHGQRRGGFVAWVSVHRTSDAVCREQRLGEPEVLLSRHLLPGRDAAFTKG